MRTVGIDLSSNPKYTAACVLRWSAGSAEIESLRVGLDDKALLALAPDCDAVGIDAPFGWPVPFVAFVGHSTTVPLDAPRWNPTWRDELRFRATDRRVREWCGITPLSVASDRIALPAMRCVGLLTAMNVTDRSGDGRVFEVYPAAAIVAWGYPRAGLKDPIAGAAARAGLLDALGTECRGLRLDEATVAACTASDHPFDALVASLGTRAAALGLTRRPAAEELERARVEGWIAVPVAGSLRRLANDGPEAVDG